MYGLGDSSELTSYSDPSLTRVRYGINEFLEANPRKSVQFKSVIAKEDPIHLFRQLNHRFNDSNLTIIEHTDHYQVDVNRKIKQSGRRIKGSFAIFQHEQSRVWTALTAEGSDFFTKGVNWVIRNTPPQIYEFYATSRDLEGVLDRFDESLDSSPFIQITQAVAYSHKDQAEISYKKRPYGVVFRQARDGRSYIDSLTFKATTEEEALLRASINRDGSTALSKGDVHLFFDKLLEQFISYGDTKADVFSGRERNRETGDVKEIEIQFDNPIFQSAEDNKLLVDALTDLSRTSVTVYHANPYAHVSILDFNDGSSSDVFVTDPKTVAIVPSYRGSTSSLMRISDKLYRELDESTLEYIEESKYGMEDFLGG
jgi:hypothetical protein